MSQSWPLSQEANKASGICSVCRATQQLHHKDGAVHKHGPRDKLSRKPPLTTVKSANNVPYSRPPPDTLDISATSAGASNVTDTTSASIWKSTGRGVDKHIPKSARSSCSVHLARQLWAAIQHPVLHCDWLGVLNGSDYPTATRAWRQTS